MFDRRMGRAGPLMAGALLVATACADNGDYEEQAGAEDVAPAAEMPSTATEGGTFTDESVVRVLDVVNKGEIDEAVLAREKTQNEEVRRFAEMMIADHDQLASQSQSSDRTQDDVPDTRSEGAPPVPETQTDPAETMIQQLQEQADSIQTQLQKLSGAEFDRAYMDRQVNAHQHVLDMMDQQLLPSAQDTQLRQSLESARPTIESHLQEARRIQQTLGSGGMPPDTGATALRGGRSAE